MPDIKQKARNMIGEEIMPTDGKHITIEDYSTYNKGYNYAKREVLRKIDQIIDIAVADRNKEIVEDIKKNITDEFELSYQSNIDITELPDELIAEMNGAKKATVGTRDFIISLISNNK